MKCSLCEMTINNYDVNFHHLSIDEKHSVDICEECSDKFFKWKSKIYSVLFPIKSLKKRFGKEK